MKNIIKEKTHKLHNIRHIPAVVDINTGLQFIKISDETACVKRRFKMESVDECCSTNLSAFATPKKERHVRALQQSETR